MGAYVLIIKFFLAPIYTFICQQVFNVVLGEVAIALRLELICYLA